MDSIISGYWKEIVDGIYNDVIITDATGTIVYANNSCEYWFGLSKEELIGKSVYDLERKKIFYPSIAKMVIKSKKRQTIIQTTKLGNKLLLNGDVIYNQQNEIQYIVTYSQDVTDFEKLKEYVKEMELELQKVKNDLAFFQNSQEKSNNMIASSSQMKQILNTSMMVANTDTSILITGETGVGKNVLAKFIHDNSQRKGALIQVNCGSLPESLLESELFGYAPGSFTGANSRGKKGLVEEAANGTLFLDEIGELPLNLQVKLLTLIQEKKFFKIGDSKPRYVNFRLITATHVNLEKKVKEKSFREDLFYRLSVIPLHIPALREREEDLAKLTLLLKDQFNHKHNKRREFHRQTLDILLGYSWPGNIRELSNLIERLILTIDSSIILPEHLPDKILMEGYTNPLNKVGDISLYEMLKEVEINILKKAKMECRSTTEMAKYLGVSQPTVVRKMQKYKEYLH
ncbi:sigma-54 interaction domain-containing protein [Pseudalkalibacillus sp. A8]|uniref:sigma-54 interaction domain-containing protein n=1 Tax=Pseudalkalibacillus sp. A8 TaxID=3382641 RepID=UPI0038B66E7D